MNYFDFNFYATVLCFILLFLLLCFSVDGIKQRLQLFVLVYMVQRLHRT